MAARPRVCRCVLLCALVAAALCAAWCAAALPDTNVRTAAVLATDAGAKCVGWKECYTEAEAKNINNVLSAFSTSLGLNSWNSFATDICAFEYITCWPSGVVMDFSNAVLTGALPSSVALNLNATQLAATPITAMIFDGNSGITGTLTSDFGYMAQVATFSATGTGLDGTLPETWSAMAGLQVLRLGTTNVNGTVPASWSALTKLTTVSLEKSRVAGPLPTEWGTLSSLVVFNGAGTKLGGTLPDAWSGMTSLQTLWLNDTAVNGTVPESWGALTRVAAVSFAGTNVTGCLPKYWQCHLGLTVTDAGLPASGACKSKSDVCSTKFPWWAILIIVLGAVVVLAVVGLVVWCVVRRRRARDDESEEGTVSEGNGASERRQSTTTSERSFEDTDSCEDTEGTEGTEGTEDTEGTTRARVPARRSEGPRTGVAARGCGNAAEKPRSGAAALRDRSRAREEVEEEGDTFSMVDAPVHTHAPSRVPQRVDSKKRVQRSRQDVARAAAGVVDNNSVSGALAPPVGELGKSGSAVPSTCTTTAISLSSSNTTERQFQNNSNPSIQKADEKTLCFNNCLVNSLGDTDVLGVGPYPLVADDPLPGTQRSAFSSLNNTVRIQKQKPDTDLPTTQTSVEGSLNYLGPQLGDAPANHLSHNAARPLVLKAVFPPQFEVAKSGASGIEPSRSPVPIVNVLTLQNVGEESTRHITAGADNSDEDSLPGDRRYLFGERVSPLPQSGLTTAQASDNERGRSPVPFVDIPLRPIRVQVSTKRHNAAANHSDEETLSGDRKYIFGGSVTPLPEPGQAAAQADANGQGRSRMPVVERSLGQERGVLAASNTAVTQEYFDVGVDGSTLPESM